MAKEWKQVSAGDVQPGSRIRVHGVELTATHVEDSFMNREGYVAFIEDTDERWFKVPSPADAVVEVAAG